MLHYRGDYRSGKRLNMRKIIPFIASSFQNDRIWLRRTKVVDRRYQVMVAVDDSSSMEENNCRQVSMAFCSEHDTPLSCIVCSGKCTELWCLSISLHIHQARLNVIIRQYAYVSEVCGALLVYICLYICV